MRTRNKCLIALIVAVTLITCLGSSVFALHGSGEHPIQDSDSGDTKQEIISLFNSDVFANPRLMEVGDEDQWKEYQENIKQTFQFIGGLTAEDGEALLTPQAINYANVDITTPAQYEVVVTLEIAPDYVENFFISEELATVKIPIHVGDPQEFDLYRMSMTSDSLRVLWLYPLDKTQPASISYCSSEEEIPSDELVLLPCTEDIAGIGVSASLLTIHRQALVQGKHYYFQITQGDTYSRILHLVDNGETLSSDTMGGDRDGGDSGGNTPPDLIQPPPTMPPPTMPPPTMPPPNGDDDSNDSEPPAPTPPAGGSESEPPASTLPMPTSPIPPPFMEFFGETEDVISGTRLKLMLRSENGVARFSKQGLTVTLKDNVFSTEPLQDSDQIRIAIEKLKDDSFSLALTMNEKNITSIPDTIVMVPYHPKQIGSALFLQDEQGGEVSAADYDNQLAVATFTVQSTGDSRRKSRRGGNVVRFIRPFQRTSRCRYEYSIRRISR